MGEFSIGKDCQWAYAVGIGWLRRVEKMPTRNVNLTDELDRFVAEKLASGRYENASEVVRAGLRMLEREEREYEAKLVALRAAIDEGDASGIAEGWSIDELLVGLGDEVEIRKAG